MINDMTRQEVEAIQKAHRDCLIILKKFQFDEIGAILTLVVGSWLSDCENAEVRRNLKILMRTALEALPMLRAIVAQEREMQRTEGYVEH